MEDLLNSNTALKNCYEKFSLDEVKQMSADNLKVLCLDERIKMAKYINELNMLSVVNESQKISKEKYVEAKIKRMEELKAFYKL
jgi:hypothetical protein